MLKVKVDINHAAMRTISTAQTKAAFATAEQMRHEIITDQVIPFDTGNLQNVATYVDPQSFKNGKDGRIMHDAPYATKVYFHPEMNFQKTFNANARGEWWEEWLTGAKRTRPMKLFAILYKKFAGGFVK